MGDRLFPSVQQFNALPPLAISLTWTTHLPGTIPSPNESTPLNTRFPYCVTVPVQLLAREFTNAGESIRMGCHVQFDRVRIHVI